MFGLQAFINNGVNLSLIPAKGMTLRSFRMAARRCWALALTAGILSLALRVAGPPAAAQRR